MRENSHCIVMQRLNYSGMEVIRIIIRIPIGWDYFIKTRAFSIAIELKSVEEVRQLLICSL